jgi:hypothetical protein
MNGSDNWTEVVSDLVREPPPGLPEPRRLVGLPLVAFVGAVLHFGSGSRKRHEPLDILADYGEDDASSVSAAQSCRQRTGRRQ